jgi:hypothetical protein
MIAANAKEPAMPPTAHRPRLLRSCGLLAVLAFGLLLSGCDKCGDFFWNRPGACKNYVPSQQ